MKIKNKLVCRFLTLVLLFGLLPSISYGQQWGTVEKSNEIKQIGNQLYYVHTVTKGNTLYSLAKAYEISVDEIKTANPDLTSELKEGKVILIPKVKESKSTEKIDISYEDYFYHVVKKGETLNSIAKIYDVKVEDIAKANNLQQSSIISTGLYLKIPEIVIQSVTVPQKVLTQQTTQNKSKYFEHIVQPKETLFSIAKRYGIGLETLKYINNFSGSSIYPGQKVLIPSVLKDWQSKESSNFIIHKVQPKEGLYGIAKKYGITIDQIKALNPGISENISIGQELKISRESNEKGYIEHLVTDRKEKLTDIAEEYDVSFRDLKELNPGARSKIKRGETVYVPIDFVDKPEDVLIVDLPTEEKKPEAPVYNKVKKRQVFEVALMLPLYLNDVDSLLDVQIQDLAANKQSIRSFRFLEFYEGAQIAVDSLRALGMQVNLHVYDVTDNEMETAVLLQDRVLLKMDLIISLLFSRSFALVSNFSKENRIPLINALSKRGQIVYENPYVFKVSPKPEALYNRVADFVGDNMSEYNIIIVRNNPYQLSTEYNLISSLLRGKIKPKVPLYNTDVLRKINKYMIGHQNSFLNILRNNLVKDDYLFKLEDMQNRPFDTIWVNNSIKTVIYSNDNLEGIMKKASLFRKNLIIAMGDDEVFAIELFTKLNFVRDSLNLDVIGLPDWKNFMNLDVGYSQPFHLRVLSENFVDYNSPDVKRFIYKFQNAFHKVPEIDTYAFLGYDATFYFMQALFHFGNRFIENIPDFQVPLLQNQMKFEKENNGGYENTYWNIYRQENYQYKLEK